MAYTPEAIELSVLLDAGEAITGKLDIVTIPDEPETNRLVSASTDAFRRFGNATIALATGAGARIGDYFAERGQSDIEPQMTTAVVTVEPKLDVDTLSLGREWLRSGVRGIKTLGHVGMYAAGITAVVAVAALTAPNVFGLNGSDGDQEAAAAEVPRTVPTTVVGEAPVTTTSTLPETTTTTTRPRFAPQVGESVGVFYMPEELCNDPILFQEYSESEDVSVVRGGQDLVGTGRATIDAQIPDPTPNGGCQPRTDRELRWEAENGGMDYEGRPDRIGLTLRGTSVSSSVGEGNPEGRVNFWQAVAGHAMSMQPEHEGEYLSAIPCEAGNATFFGHGSTESAGFGDMRLMEIGDTGSFQRADGLLCHYEVIDFDIVPEDRYSEEIINYVSPYGPDAATISLAYCTGIPEGQLGAGAPGTGSEYRGVVRVAITDSEWVR